MKKAMEIGCGAVYMWKHVTITPLMEAQIYYELSSSDWLLGKFSQTATNLWTR